MILGALAGVGPVRQNQLGVNRYRGHGIGIFGDERNPPRVLPL